MSSESQAENTQENLLKKTNTLSVQKNSPLASIEKNTKQESQFIEGKHYVEIFPEMQTDTPPGKIEVIELFWLGCPHCYTLEPTIKQYKENIPEYIDFKQVPATFNANWRSHAKIFYTAKALDPNNELKLIDKMFYAIHKQGRNLLSVNSQKRFFEQHGVEAKAFDSAFNSILVKTQLSRAKTVSDLSQATSVPSIIIAGKYRTSPHLAGSSKKLLDVIKFLTQKIRNTTK